MTEDQDTIPQSLTSTKDLDSDLIADYESSKELVKNYSEIIDYYDQIIPLTKRVRKGIQ